MFMRLDKDVKEQSNKDLEWIKNFSKIKIMAICRDLNINKPNLWTGKTSAENIASCTLTVDADMGIFFRRINPLCSIGADHRQRVQLHRLII